MSSLAIQSVMVSATDSADHPQEFPVWMGRVSRLLVHAPEGIGSIRIKVSSGPEALYDYFPFLSYISVGGRHVAIVEFDKPFDEQIVEIPLVEGDRPIQLEFQTELGAKADERGLGPDERELALQLRAVEWQATEERRPSRSFKPASSSAGEPPRLTPIADADCEPVFVIGSYRSGTSISVWTLGQHPNLMALEETVWLPMLYFSSIAAHDMASTASRSPTKIYDLSPSSFARWQGSAINRLHQGIGLDRSAYVGLERLSAKGEFDPRFQLTRSRFAPKRRWVDGTPENTFIALGLAEMFPAAKFIFMLRQPEQVLASLMEFDVAGGESRSFEQACDEWERISQSGYEALQVLGSDRVFLSSYQRLKDEPEMLVRDWFDFLGEPNFAKAVETLGHRINSSETSRTLPPEYASELQRLTALYNGMSAGVAYDSLPWKNPRDSFRARRRTIVDRLKACFI